MITWTDTTANTSEVATFNSDGISFQPIRFHSGREDGLSIYSQDHLLGFCDDNVIFAGGFPAKWVANQTDFSPWNGTCFIEPPPFDAFPIFTLNSPADLTTTNNTIVNFNCSATDDNQLTNISLFHNSSGTFELINSTVITGVSDTAIFEEIIPINTTIVWNCLATDNATQSNFSINNFSLRIFQDFLEVNLINPVNNFTSITGLVDFEYNVLHSFFTIDNCTINFNGLANTTNVAIPQGINTFTGFNFTNSTFNWNVECANDGLFSYANNFTLNIGITEPPPEPELLGIFSIGQCPTSESARFLLALFFVISLVLVLMGESMKAPIFTTLGGVGIFILSFSIFGCFFMIGLLVMFAGLLLFFRSMMLLGKDTPRGFGGS